MRPIDRKQGRGQMYGLMLCMAAVFFSAVASADGFMSTARDTEGRWWLVDGAGNRTLEMGVGWVSPRGPRNNVTGKHPYWETTKAKYAAPGASGGRALPCVRAPVGRGVLDPPGRGTPGHGSGLSGIIGDFGGMIRKGE